MINDGQFRVGILRGIKLHSAYAPTYSMQFDHRSHRGIAATLNLNPWEFGK
jgi:hypothetical protein